MTFESMQSLADRALLFVGLRQEQLSEALDTLGEYNWEGDLDAGTLTFRSTDNPSQTLETRAELIASLAPGPRSLMWGWDHQQGHSDRKAAQLRAYGEQYQLADLTSGELAFPENTGSDLDDWIATASHTVGAVATEITGASPYYAAPVGGGTRAVFLLDLALPPLTVAKTSISLPRLLSGIALADARTSVWDLARLASWQLAWHDDAYTGATLTDSTGQISLSFDDHARISKIEATMTEL